MGHQPTAVITNEPTGPMLKIDMKLTFWQRLKILFNENFVLKLHVKFEDKERVTRYDN